MPNKKRKIVDELKAQILNRIRIAAQLKAQKLYRLLVRET